MVSSYAINRHLEPDLPQQYQLDKLLSEVAMLTTKDTNDPKGKSVETTITNTSPRVLIVDNSSYDCFVESNLLIRYNVQGIYGCYYGFLVALYKIVFKKVYFSNILYMFSPTLILFCGTYNLLHLYFLGFQHLQLELHC